MYCPAAKTKDVIRFLGTSRETTTDLEVMRSIAETLRECDLDIFFTNLKIIIIAPKEIHKQF